MSRLRVDGDGDCGAGETHTRRREISRRRSPRVTSPLNFARPTIATAKIRDYSQSNFCQEHSVIVDCEAYTVDENSRFRVLIT